MSHVLVTGANGFVGTNLVEMLQERGDEVTCLVRESPRLERLRSLGAKLTLIQGLDDIDAIQLAIAGQEIVYHIAGATKAIDRRCLYEVNEQGASHVARACANQSDPPILIHLSSLAAWGPSLVDRPVHEGDPPHPVSEYGRSKLAGERAVRRWADRVPTTIVRPAIVLGPADVDGLAMFRPIKRFGVHVTPGSSTERYSVIHVTDLCRLLILAAERGRRIVPEETDQTRAVGCYFGTTDEYPTWGELGRIVGKALGRHDVLVVSIPKPIVWSVAASVETVSHAIRRPLYLNWDKVHEIMAGSWTCSPEAAVKELGMTFETPLDERLAETVAWYRETNWL